MNLHNLKCHKTPVQIIEHPMLTARKIRLKIKRDDLNHPLLNGNKWHKIKFNILNLQQRKKSNVFSFSGPFSNHLHALSCASRLFQFDLTMFVRGPTIDFNNPTIRFAKACGVSIIPLSRQAYRNKQDEKFLDELSEQFKVPVHIPEGGSNQLAVQGVAEFAKELHDCDIIVVPVGSAGTLSGLIHGAAAHQKILGIAVLKQGEYLHEQITHLLGYQAQSRYQLITDMHNGGYGKFSPELWQFCQWFNEVYNVPLEPIYSGKMMFALWQLIERGYFSPNQDIMAIHTGGMQGLQGLRYMNRL